MPVNKQLLSQAANDVLACIDWESLGIPVDHKCYPLFKKFADGFSLTSTRGTEDLLSVVKRLCVYGFADRAAAAAWALREVPNEPPVSYNYVSQTMTTAACFADRAGLDAKPLITVAQRPPGRPVFRGATGLDGSRLDRLFDQTKYDRETYVGWAFGDLGRLADMWVFGSPNRKWDRKAIGAEIDKNVAGIVSLPGWGAWR